MNRSASKFRALVLGIVVLQAAVVGTVAMAGTAAAANTITVTAGNQGDFSSIQSAVDAAEPGDTITVAEGTYTETVNVTTSDLTITGEPGSSVGVAGAAPILANSSTFRTGFNAGFFVEDGADGVTIEGFEIRDFEYGVVVDTAGMFGGQTGTSAGVRVRSNTMDGVGHAVFGVAEGEGSTLESVAVRDNDLSGTVAFYAINEGVVDGVSITDNDIVMDAVGTHGNGVSLYAYEIEWDNDLGLEDPDPAPEYLRNALVRGNEIDLRSTHDGVQLMYHETGVGSNVTVTDNRLRGTSRNTGFLLEGNGTYDDVDLTDNRINGTKQALKTRPEDSNQQGPTNVTDVTFSHNYVEDRLVVQPSVVGELNASYNYWNAPDGPSGFYDGSGVSVPENVRVEPFYVDSERTQLNVKNVDTGANYPGLNWAIEDASPGDTIELYDGTYELTGVTVNKPVTIAGAGRNETQLEGGSSGLTLDARNVTIRNLSLTADGTGIDVPVWADASGLRVENVSIVNAGDFGVYVAGDTIHGEAGDNGAFDDVHFRDVAVRNHDEKGLYVEKLSNAVFEDVVVDGVTSDAGPYNNGIDINLKDGTYQNVTIRDTIVANVSEGEPLDPSLSAAVAVKARDDGDYAESPATLAGVTIANVSIRDSYNGLRFGEPGVEYVSGSEPVAPESREAPGPQGPTDVSVRNSVFASNDRYHVQDLAGSVDGDLLANNSFDDAVTVNDSGPGLSSTVWSAVQLGVSHARPGGTVEVHPGNYTESVDVATRNVTLEGNATIEGPVTLSAPGTGLRELTIRPPLFTPGDRPVAAVLVTGSDTLVENTTITANGDAGSGEGSVTVNGIQVFGGGTPVSNVSIRSNTVDAVSNEGSSRRPNYGGSVGVKVQGTVEDVVVTGNLVEDISSAGWSHGVSVTPSDIAPSVSPKNVSVVGNAIRDVAAEEHDGVALGVDTLSGPVGGPHPTNASQVHVHRNEFVDADVGALNKDTEHELNATWNWWGAPSGPGGAGPGSGTAVSENVTYTPWLGSPPGVYFDVELGAVNDSMTVTETQRIRGTIRNTGEESYEQSVRFLVDGDVRVTRNVTLDVGGVYDVAFTFEPRGVGNRTVAIASDDDAANATVRVENEGVDGRGPTDGGGSGPFGDPPDQESTPGDPSETTPEERPGDDSSGAGDPDDSPGLSDADPDRPGTTVELQGTTIVTRVTFDSEDIGGSLQIEEYENPPAAVRSAIAAQIGEDVPVVAAADISPTDAAAASTSATVEFSISADRFSDPENAVVAHRPSDGTWELRETTVERVDEGRVHLSASVESFSMFAILERQSRANSPTATPAARPGGETDADDPTTPAAEPGGFGLVPFVGIVGLVALIVGGLGLYRREGL
jgi:hypothetical protein